MKYMKSSFGSDNHSPAHPRILEAIIEANSQYCVAYGEDQYTESVLNMIEDSLGGNCKAFFTVNGTGANIFCLASLIHSSDSILCASTAHINVDECGAPEKQIGAKIVPLNHINGKVSPEEVKKHLIGFGFQHHSQPKVLSISQPTELGTLYTQEEIIALADLMHAHNCYLHIDGSRISNAAAASGLSVKELTMDCGVDALSFGGTKNGLIIGECAILSARVLSGRELYIRKQMTQLYSKHRYISAQFEAFLKDDLNLSIAKQANDMASYLSSEISKIPQITISRPVESNAVFAFISQGLYDYLIERHYFYIWDEETMEVRWMCSFCTSKEEIDLFILDINNYLNSKL